MAEIRYLKAINEALSDAMSADPTVILMGEDVGEAGGPFGASRGLRDKFGPARVLDTPISEAALAGAAVGAALSGLKPVLEIMFMDFTTLVMDAMVNQAAKARFMFGGQGSVPMVLRTPHGGGLGAGPQHSQCLEAWFAHVPGLKVVCPSDPASAYGLLRAAIEDPDPVVFIEHKALYAMKAEVPEALPVLPLGKAATLREGRDVTLVAYGAAVHTCLSAAKTLAAEGIEAEVIDLRSLLPLAEKYDQYLGYEIHAPSGPNNPQVLQMREMYEELQSERLGFTADFSSTMHSLSPTLLRTMSQMGMPEQYFSVMDEIWHEPTPMHVRNQKFEDFLTSENFDFARLGPFTRLAFNMHGLVPPEEWLDIMPQIFHVHAKFYDIDENGDEPAMDIRRIVKQFVVGGYQGYLSSEWEGHAFSDLGESDPIDLVKKQHTLMRSAIEETVANA